MGIDLQPGGKSLFMGRRDFERLKRKAYVPSTQSNPAVTTE
jgi:hypothetical protein